MAAESNTGFFHEGTLGSALSRHAISFQSGAVNSSSEMIPMAGYYGVNSTASMLFSGNSNMVSNNPGVTQAGSSSGSLLLDSVPGLKHETGLAVEWSVEEQCKLEKGLDKYADEPSIMRYIKIAATLRDKTVRDVALRCRWMTRKRRKQEEHNLGKKVKDKKLHDNIELFFRTRNNIAGILNDMREMPGIMSQMPPLPVSLNEELANSIMPSTSQAMMFGSSSGIQLKQEPGC